MQEQGNLFQYKEINTLDDEQALKFIVNNVENLDDLFKYINDEIKIFKRVIMGDANEYNGGKR